MLHVTDDLLEGLAAAVGERQVLVDDDVRAPFESDWTGRYRGAARAVVRPARPPAGPEGGARNRGGARAVVRPADAHEVSAVLAACRAHGAAVVPQGGNTG